MTVYIIMGVSGSGKSTIGQKIAGSLQLPFFEGDDFHPRSNKEKMIAGIPLQNSDRLEWISSLAGAINKIRTDCVVSCSALNPTVRNWIEEQVEQEAKFICLSASRDVLLGRLRTRSEHFFPPELLTSQIEALEVSDEIACVNVQHSIEIVVDKVLNIIRGG